MMKCNIEFDDKINREVLLVDGDEDEEPAEWDDEVFEDDDFDDEDFDEDDEENNDDDD